MFGPRGTGIVRANAANGARLQPLVPNFTELESYVAWTKGRAPAGPCNAAWKVRTPRSAALSAGLVAFKIGSVRPYAIVKQLLARRLIARTSPYAASCARLAPSLINTPAEVDEALRAVPAIAG